MHLLHILVLLSKHHTVMRYTGVEETHATRWVISNTDSLHESFAFKDENL